MISKLKAIVGPPTSGKSEALMIDLRVTKRGNRRVVAFLDPDSANGLAASDESLDGIPHHFVRSIAQLRALLRDDVEVVGIEGAHRLGAGIVELCLELTGEGKQVITTSLELDDVWGPLPICGNLLAVADDVQKTTGVCTICRAPARFALRRGGEAAATVTYELRCRACREK